MVEVFAPENRGTHLSCWHEAIRAKLLGTGKEYGREEFDKVLGNYSVCPLLSFSKKPPSLNLNRPNDGSEAGSN